MARTLTIDCGGGRSVTVRLTVAVQARYVDIIRRSQLAGGDPASAALALVAAGPQLAPGHLVGGEGFGSPFDVERFLDEADLDTQIRVFSEACAAMMPSPVEEEAEQTGLDPRPSGTGSQ